MRSKLHNPCVLCGETKGIEMHHVRHLRKEKAKGFHKILQVIKRKQISVCQLCHQRIHNGIDDGISLKDFKYPETA